MLITRDDIQRVGDEETLLHFLEEKLNLPISEGLTLEDITIKFGKLALGLSGVVADQVLDCQELGFSPGEPSGIILIRFTNESDYAETLRTVAEGLGKLGRNPADLRFICMNGYFQPFAFAHFSDSGSGNRQTTVLNILAWTQDNTHIHTNSEHKLPTDFFANKPSENFSDASDIFAEEITPDIFDEEEFDDNDIFVDINDASDTSVDKPLEIFDNKPTRRIVESASPQALLTKLESIGTALGQHANIYAGIVAGGNKLYVIDPLTRERLLNADPRSGELIKPIQGSHQKWQAESKSMIWIPSTKNKHWSWSDAKTETEAEKIFAQTYLEISDYLSQHRDKLKSYAPAFKGKFWWEFPSAMAYSEIILQKPKILYPFGIKSMRASHDPTGKIIPRGLWFIPTEDMSLLAILNSRLFNWHAQARYKKFGKNWYGIFGRENMESITIADKIKVQRELSDWVDQILSDPTNNDVPAIEKEIDALVYDLYNLTSTEIALVEEETNP